MSPADSNGAGQGRAVADPARLFVITGGHGFLGWHTACRLRAVHGVEPVRVGRETMADPDALTSLLDRADAVLHLAGVNRATSDELVEQGNVAAAKALATALRRCARPLPVVYANSIHADRDSAYGRGKAAAARILRAASPGPFADVMLPNVFGEHARPSYNSFVATFAHEVANGREPIVTADRQVPLLHAQDAAEELIRAADSGASGVRRPEAPERGVVEVRDRLARMHELYAKGEIPPLACTFDVHLFNTYRAYRFPGMFPFVAEAHADERGELFETVRAHLGPGMAFVSTTRPGQRRGDHYHLHKVERFFVVRGDAEISLRRLLHDDVVTFRLSGTRPSFVDMPTLWTHNIKNVGDDDLVTMFWADQLLDPAAPDQYPERVDVTEAAPA